MRVNSLLGTDEIMTDNENRDTIWAQIKGVTKITGIRPCCQESERVGLLFEADYGVSCFSDTGDLDRSYLPIFLVLVEQPIS